MRRPRASSTPAHAADGESDERHRFARRRFADRAQSRAWPMPPLAGSPPRAPINAGRTSGQTSEATSSTQGLREAARIARGRNIRKSATLMKPEHPEMVSLRARISELDRQIAREGATVAVGPVKLASCRISRRRLRPSARCSARVAQLKGDVLNLRGRSIQYTILQRDVDTNRALYDALLQRYKEIGVAGGIGTAPVSIVDRADVPGGAIQAQLDDEPADRARSSACWRESPSPFALEFLNDTIKTPRGRAQEARARVPWSHSEAAPARTRSWRISRIRHRRCPRPIPRS